MRILTLVAVVALVAILALYFAGGDPSSREALSGVEVELELKRDVAPSLPGPATQSSEAQRHAEPRQDDPSTALEEAQATATAPRPSLTHAVEVILIDADGIEHVGLSGEALCLFTAGRERTFQRIPIEYGRLSFAIGDRAQFELRSTILDGRPALPETIGERFEVEELPLMLRVVRPASVVLSVLDALTEQHLERVELRECSSMPSGGLSVPDERWNRRTAGDGHSPLLLEAEPAEARRPRGQRFLVHSPGYAWTPVTLDMSAPGEHEVRLERACGLEVKLEGELPRRTSKLGLYRVGGDHQAPVAELPVIREREHEFEGLPPGAYRVRLEIGDWYRDRIPLGQVSVELPAGESRSVLLSIIAPPPVERARLAGTVRVAAGWELDEMMVYARFEGTLLDVDGRNNYLALNSLQASAESAGTFLFDFGELQLGEYRVGARSGPGDVDFDVNQALRLGPDGVTDVLLDVQAPCEVVLTLRDAQSGEALGDTILWQSVGSDGGYTGAVRAPGNESFEFRAPAGEIRLHGYAPEYIPIHETVAISPGPNPFTFQVERACILRLLLRDGETPVLWGEGWELDVKHADSGASSVTMSGSGSERSLGFAEPGRYRLDRLEVEGYETVRDLEFEARRGETVEHVIALKRK